MSAQGPRRPRDVSVIGRGKVGTALANALRAAGVSVHHLRGRRTRAFPALAETVIVCVPDDAIAVTARALVTRLTARSVVVHCAGARPPDELAACRSAGAAVATFHPLASFADARRPPDLHACTFVCAGDTRALRRARTLSRQLGARFVVADLNDATYHAAAALLANGAVALACASHAMLREVGVSARAADHALAGLLLSVAHNLADIGVQGALTGPVARGDSATVARHIDALRSRVPAHAETYVALLPALRRAARAQRQK